jgi:hypothetical protein
LNLSHLGETGFVLKVHGQQLVMDAVTVDGFLEVLSEPQITDQGLSE